MALLNSDWIPSARPVQRTPAIPGDNTAPPMVGGAPPPGAVQQMPQFQQGGLLQGSYNPFNNQSAGLFDQYQQGQFGQRYTPPMMGSRGVQNQGGFMGFNSPAMTPVTNSSFNPQMLQQLLDAIRGAQSSGSSSGGPGIGSNTGPDGTGDSGTSGAGGTGVGGAGGTGVGASPYARARAPMGMLGKRGY